MSDIDTSLAVYQFGGHDRCPSFWQYMIDIPNRSCVEFDMNGFNSIQGGNPFRNSYSPFGSSHRGPKTDTCGPIQKSGAGNSALSEILSKLSPLFQQLQQSGQAQQPQKTQSSEGGNDLALLLEKLIQLVQQKGGKGSEELVQVLSGLDVFCA